MSTSIRSFTKSIHAPVLIAICVALAACSSDDKGKSSGFVDKTDYSTCQGPTSSDLTLYNTWYRYMPADAGLTSMMKFKFEPNRLTMSNNCTSSSSDISVSVSSTIQVSGNEIEIWSSRQDENSDGVISCSVGMNSGTVRYSFQGQCLKLSMAGQPDMLFPLLEKSQSGGGSTRPRPNPPVPRPLPPTPRPNPTPRPPTKKLELPEAELKLSAPFELSKLNEIIVSETRADEISASFRFALDKDYSFSIGSGFISEHVTGCTDYNGVNSKLMWLKGDNGYSQDVVLGAKYRLEPGSYTLKVNYVNEKACRSIAYKFVAQITQVAPPQPEPAPRPKTVIEELREAGVRVDEFRDNMPTPPGGPDNHTLRRQFYTELEKARAVVLRLAPRLSSLVIASYASYDAKTKRGSILTLSDRFSAAQIEEYVAVAETRQNLTDETGIVIDLGIDLYGIERGDILSGARSLNEFLVERKHELNTLKYLVKKIENKISGEPGFYWYDKAIQIRREDIRAKWTSVVYPLLTASQFYQFADAIGVQIEVGSGTVLKPNAPFVPLQALAGFKDELEELATTGILKKITLEEYGRGIQFEEREGKLVLPFDQAKFALLGPVLKAMVDQNQIAKTMGIKIEFSPYGFNPYDQSYVDGVRLLRSVESILLAKTDKIKSISLGIKERSEFSFFAGILYVGTKDRTRDLERVIKNIR